MGKVLINLLSKQIIPNYIAIKQYKPDTVVSVTTGESAQQFEDFQNLIKKGIIENNIEFHKVNIEPYALSATIEILSKLVSGEELSFTKNKKSWSVKLKEGSEIILNYTGGTKQMAIAAIQAVQANNSVRCKLVYVDSKNRLFRETDPKFSVENNVDISAFLKLNEVVSLHNQTLAPKKAPKDKANLFEIAKIVADNNKKNKRNIFLSRIRKGELHELPDGYEVVNENGKTTINFPDTDKSFEVEEDEVSFLKGEWLEYYTQELLNKINGLEVSQNVKFNYTKTVTSKMEGDIQYLIKKKVIKDSNEFHKSEIDIIVNDGLNFAIGECKSGNVKQDHLYKLSALTEHYFGSHTKKFMIVANTKTNAAIKKKAGELKIKIFSQEDWSSDDFLEKFKRFLGMVC